LAGSVKPHHVLLFIENEVEQPGDKGAFILNKEDTDAGKVIKLLEDGFVRLKQIITHKEADTMAKDKTKEELDAEKEEEMKATKATIAKAEADFKALQAQMQTATAASEAKFKELEAKFTALAAENTTLKANLEAASKELSTFKAGQIEKDWSTFKEHLPLGMTRGEKEKEARALWEKDPREIALKALTFKDEAEPLGGEEGMTFTAPTGLIIPEKSEVGRWDPSTNKWVPH
jgi:chromosome segregation ATPase